MLNVVHLIGHLGKDPEIKAVGETSVTKFTLATSERWKNKDGEQKESTQWHNIECWGKLAEIVAQYCSKGKQVYVSGRIEYRTYEGEDGTKKYFTQIKATEVKFLGSKGEGPAPVAAGEPNDSVEDNDVIPF